MRVMVTGSRAWTDAGVIANCFITFEGQNHGPHTLVSGGARGADLLAERVAKGLGWEVETWVPDWRRLGAYAGKFRNAQMAESGVDAAFAFWLDGSAGTLDAINRLLDVGVPVTIMSMKSQPADSSSDL